MFDYASFLRAVMDRTGLTKAWAAERAIEATVEAVGARLPPTDRIGVSLLVGLPFSEMLMRRPIAPDEDLADLLADVTCAEGVEPTFAFEHVETIARLLAERLDHDGVVALRQHLPTDIAALFVPREAREARLTPARGPRAHRRSVPISEARSVSSHPVSESRPARAHSGSPARTSTPHDDTKLSSARGLTQQREHESLAEGHPGSDDPLGEWKH